MSASDREVQNRITTLSAAGQPIRRLSTLTGNSNGGGIEDHEYGDGDNQRSSSSSSLMQAHLLHILQEAARITDFFEDEDDDAGEVPNMEQ